MSEHSNVVDRADLLMRRRRSFVAQRNEPEAVAVQEPSAELLTYPDDEDIPELTEIVAPENDALEYAMADPAPQESPPAPAASIDANADRIESLAQDVAQEIAQAIEQQIAYELPSLLEATLSKASEELRAGIHSTIETALRDFSARRKAQQQASDEQNALL